MKHLGIHKPCTENWNGMSPTEKGAFCQKCCKQVIDFTHQTSSQIRKTLLERKGQEVCGRIENGQLDALNRDFEVWRQSNSWSMQRVSFYAFLFVFGLSIVSCSHKEDEKQIIQLQETAQKMIQQDAPEMSKVKDSPENAPQHLILLPKNEKVLEKEYLVEHEIMSEEIYTTVEHRYVTMGAMVNTRDYLDYLEATPVIEAVNEVKRCDIPTEFNAFAFPNPTEGRTTLKFEVPTATDASFELYSMSGSKIRSMGASAYEPGTHEIPFDLSDEQPGTYLIVVLSKGFKESVKVIKL